VWQRYDGVRLRAVIAITDRRNLRKLDPACEKCKDCHPVLTTMPQAA
jgi:hypothetical protein